MLAFMRHALVRRRALWAAAMLLPALAAHSAPVEQNIVHQEVDFAAPPHRIYDALLDEKQFSAMTGAPGSIQRHEGGSFSLFGGAIVGRNIELVADQRIVQAWRDAAWKPGVYSLVRFELVPHGGGTHLVLDHAGYPPGEFHSLSIGWPAHYWEPMKKAIR
jgi:activator of HSP90 ATPase